MNTPEKSTKLGAHYIRTLLSYLTILAIPLILLSFFYSFRFLKQYHEEVYETVDMELMQVSSRFENQIELMETIVGQLTISGILKQATSEGSIMNLDPIISNLSMFTTANSFIEDIILIPDWKEYVTTSSTTCDKSYFFKRIFTLSDIKESEIMGFLQSPTKQIITNQQAINLGISNFANPAVLFLFPLYTDFNKKVGTVIFHVQESSITDLVSQRLTSYQAHVAIIDKNNHIVASTPDDSSLDILLSNRASSFKAQTKEESDYLIRSYASESWNYYALIKDSHTSFSQVNALMREFILTIVGILILSASIILIFQKINYKPMKLLNNKVGLLSANTKSRDELANISNALDFLSTQNSSLSIQLKNSLSAVQTERINRLISSRYTSKDDFNMDCSELDMELYEDHFVICLFLFHTNTEFLNTIAEDLKILFKDFHTLNGLHTFNQNQLVMLYNLSAQEDIPLSLYKEAQLIIAHKFHLETTIGIGSKVEGTQTIAQSYLEAVRALEYRFVKGNNSIITIKEVEKIQLTNTLYPQKEFETLRNTLLAHSVSEVRQAIQDIINFMEKNQLPLYLVRSICFDFIHLVNDYSYDSNTANPIELSGMETASEIIQQIKKWSSQIENLSKGSSKIALEDVYEFLDQNCLRCAFSVYETAEHFGMTLPTFSKFFKNATGQNVIDYTLGYRISVAKLLLETTDLPLKDIAERVGYYNMSSFTRRFKLDQGITPSDYRKIQEQKRT